MDRILNMFSNRSVRRFTAASLLCMLLCTLGGWALAEKQARQNVRLLQTQQLQIAGKLESSMPEAREQIRSAMLGSVQRKTWHEGKLCWAHTGCESRIRLLRPIRHIRLFGNSFLQICCFTA